MDKEHLVDLISCSFYLDGERDNTRKITNEFKKIKEIHNPKNSPELFL